MEKDPRKFVFPTTIWIVLLCITLLYVDLLRVGVIHLDHSFAGVQYISSSKTIVSRPPVLVNGTVEDKHMEEFLDPIFSRLVKDREKLKSRDLACNKGVYSFSCIVKRKVVIDTGTMTVNIPSENPVKETVIRPYARQEDKILLEKVAPVKILEGNITTTELPICKYNHEQPAVIFSSSGFVGNVFHEINEIIIPLFITTRIFKSQVKFIMVDYDPSFVRKYANVLSNLTAYEIINPAVNQSVHCFPGVIVGLHFHNHLSISPKDIPGNLSIQDFREFFRRSFGLRYSHVSQIPKPRLMLLSRTTTRRIINEDEIVKMMEEVGFEVIVVARAKVIKNMDLFARLINSCVALVGAHGAGLTNELFLPNGAVMVQVDLVGLDWAAASYYGNPARAMGVHYLRYKIEPQESSLLKIFGRHDHIAFTDPRGAFPTAVGREVYLNGQNVRLDVARFRETMVEAISLVKI